MNYPVWDVPASGLLIAAVAIVHVFISHFAVGGGLFLVLAERRARRDRDEALLGYVRLHSRFFVVLTMVLGAITGVGIWFTIGLVHPEATASLITIFVWVWAIEWTMFATEIAAALVYYYGWDRLSARAHLRVGWIYFWAAWLSLVVINGILAFMLTPGNWLSTRRVADAFLNPTYVSSVAGRTFAAVGLAGIYALFTAAWLKDPALKAKVARYAGLSWVVPMAVAVPLSLLWYLSAAAASGVPVREILGARADGLGAMMMAILRGADSGYPVAQRAALVGLAGSVAALVITLLIVAVRPRAFGRPLAAAVMLAGFAALGGAEWVREDLRKPYVIGQYMLVNGVRLPPGPAVPAPTPEAVAALRADGFAIDVLNQRGVLASSPWVRLPGEPQSPSAANRVAHLSARGREVFRLECARCHTVNGYLAIRPLVAGKSTSALGGTIDRLARPVNTSGQPVGWNEPRLQLVTWRGRRMPPFVGTVEERDALAVYLAVLGGQSAESLATAMGETGVAGKASFEERCAACHGPETDWPIGPRVRGRTAEQFYDLLGRLPQINEAMPPFDGTDTERRALAAYVATLGAPAGGKGGPR
jgi:mono/diheme cytochrome c family protein